MGILDIFSNVFYIFVAILVLLFMVTVHELGHYVAGKLLNFKINEFAIGFGPSIYKRTSKKTGEIFSLRIIPLGGYCAFEGEDEEQDNPRSFNNQKPWKRIIVLLAGVTMNFIFSLLIAIIVFASVGMYFPAVSEVSPDSAETTVLEDLKLKQGDIILAVNGEFLYLNGDLNKALNKVPVDKKFNVTVVREGQRKEIDVIKRNYAYTDKEGNEKIAYGLGIVPTSDSHNLGFFEAIEKGTVYCFKMAGVILGFFGDLITGKINFNQIGGPITTIDYTVQVAKHGFRPLMEIVTLIGVNLAVFNILPIPALDGSRILFIIIEWIRRKPVKRELEGKIHFIGLLFLFGFVILADILQIFNRL